MFDWLSNHQDYVTGALQVIGGASVIASATPTKWDNKILDTLSTIIHLLAFNFGKAGQNNGR